MKMDFKMDSEKYTYKKAFLLHEILTAGKF